MSEPFDIKAARTYAGRELHPDDSYHASELLAACDEIERLREVLRRIAETPWMGEDYDGNDKAAQIMRGLAAEASATNSEPR